MKSNLLFITLVFITMVSCQSKYYSMDDFEAVEKIDAHYHMYTNKNVTMEQAQKDNFKILSINTFTGNCQHTVEAHQWMKSLKTNFPEDFEFSATFCLDDWDNPAWEENTISWIDQCISDGANSVKVWKNIGMEFRNNDSVLIMIDDPKFDPVFNYLADKGIPLVGHLGEPKNCWLPLNEMTTKNDSNYFENNPQYHMYKHPELPSYEEL